MRVGVVAAALLIGGSSLIGLSGCVAIAQGDQGGVVVAHSIYASLEQRYSLAQQYCAQFGRHAVLQSTLDPDHTAYACITDQLPPDRPLPPPPGVRAPRPSPPGPVSGGPLPPLP